MLYFSLVSATALPVQEDDSEYGVFSAMSNMGSYFSWGSNSNFLEEARKMNEAGQSPYRKTKRFKVAASRFSPKEDKNDQGESATWIGSVYSYFSGESKDEAKKEAEAEEGDGYISSAYKYVASHVLSDRDESAESKETQKSNLKSKVKLWHVILIIGIALVVLVAAIGLVYGFGKRKRGEKGSKIYSRV